MARKGSVIKHVTTGSVLDDLNFPPEVLAELKLRAQLHADVYEIASQYTQLELQNIWKESQPRVSDFMRGKVSKFSIERLLRYAAQLGMRPQIKTTGTTNHTHELAAFAR